MQPLARLGDKHPGPMTDPSLSFTVISFAVDNDGFFGCQRQALLNCDRVMNSRIEPDFSWAPHMLLPTVVKTN